EATVRAKGALDVGGGEVADGPVVANGGDRRYVEARGGGDGRRRGERVLSMHDVHGPSADLCDEKFLETPTQSEVALPAAHIWHVVELIAKVRGVDALVLSASDACEVRLRHHHAHRVPAGGERAREVKRAPAAAPAARRKGVGDDQHAHWLAAENAIPTRP